MALFSPDGRVVRAGDALAELLRPGGRLEGEFVEALSGDPAWSLGLAAARGRGRWSGRLRVEQRELEVSLRVAPSGYGVLVCRDVSEQVAHQQRAATLEARVEEESHRAASARELLFEQSERLTTVHRIGYEAVGSTTVRDTAAASVQALAADLRAELVAVWLLVDGALHRVASTGPAAEVVPAEAAGAVLDGGRPDEGVGPLAGLVLFALPGREGALGVLGVRPAPDRDAVQLYLPHVAAALANARLTEEIAHAHAELLAIDQQKTEFLNTVAHDLRTPLTCIRTYTDLMRMYVDEPPETYAEFLQIICEETERLGLLLDNFLDLARLENATMRFELEPVRIDELIEHFGHVYSAKAAAEGIELWSEVDRHLPELVADRLRLEQVFSNLLANAFRFTPSGGQIGIEARATEDGVSVWVRDSGPGVPVEDRRRIFERFRQARGIDRSRGGAGLGLAIVHAIVTAHGGRIWVDDAPGGGAMFVFTLPFVPPPELAAGDADG